MKYGEKKRLTVLKILVVVIVLAVIAVAVFDFAPAKETKEITIPFTR